MILSSTARDNKLDRNRFCRILRFIGVESIPATTLPPCKTQSRARCYAQNLESKSAINDDDDDDDDEKIG
jgi:hypothetical protein